MTLIVQIANRQQSYYLIYMRLRRLQRPRAPVALLPPTALSPLTDESVAAVISYLIANRL